MKIWMLRSISKTMNDSNSNTVDGEQTDPTPNCPVCGSEPSDVSWQTAPGQQVCTAHCPVNTWNSKVEYLNE